MIARRALVAMLLASFVGGCASVPYAQRVQQRQAAYLAAAGASVHSFRFVTLYSWEPLGDSQLVVYTRPDQAWLLDVWSTCTPLMFSSAIGLTSNLDEVTVHFDKVLTGHEDPPCNIEQIRPVDLARLKVEKEAQRQINSEQRAAISAGASRPG